MEGRSLFTLNQLARHHQTHGKNNKLFVRHVCKRDLFEILFQVDFLAGADPVPLCTEHALCRETTHLRGLNDTKTHFKVRHGRPQKSAQGNEKCQMERNQADDNLTDPISSSSSHTL